MIFARCNSICVTCVVFLSVGFLFGCSGQPAPTKEALPTSAPVTAQPSDTPTVEPTPAEPAPDQPEEAPSEATEQPAAVGGGTRLRVTPSEDGSAAEIWVDDVEGLYALDIQLSFDPQRFQVDDADPDKDGIQLEVGQVPAPDFVAMNSVDNATGEVHYVVTQLGTTDAFSGSGMVAKLHWKAGVSAQSVEDANSALSFGTITLVDRDVQQIDVKTE